MSEAFLALGSDSWISREEIVVIARPDSEPVQALLREYKGQCRLIDLTHRRPTRAVIFTASGHAVLVARRPKTLVARLLTDAP